MFKTADDTHRYLQDAGYFTRRADELANDGEYEDALLAMEDAIATATRVLQTLKAAKTDIEDARLEAFIEQTDAILEGGN